MTTKKQPVVSEIMASPLTPGDRELLAMQPLIAQFPVAFGNNAVWEEFDGECYCCGKTLRRELVRGIVVLPIPVDMAHVQSRSEAWMSGFRG